MHGVQSEYSIPDGFPKPNVIMIQKRENKIFLLIFRAFRDVFMYCLFNCFHTKFA